ncbi:MAG: MFS transporter [Acetobacteraceae bacterium]
MSVISGYLVHSLGWRGMFVAEGIPAILWAFCWRRLVDDHPAQADWLSPAQRSEIERRLSDEQAEFKPVKKLRPGVPLQDGDPADAAIHVLEHRHLRVHSLATLDARAGSKFGIVAIGWLSAGPYLLAAILMVAASFASDRFGARKLAIWPFLLIGAIALYASYDIGQGNFWLSYGLLVVAGGAMYAPYGPFFALIPEILPRNVAGGSIAMINSFGALGSFLGTYFVGFLNARTGSDHLSFLFMAICLVASAILTLLVREDAPAVGQHTPHPAPRVRAA